MPHWLVIVGAIIALAIVIMRLISICSEQRSDRDWINKLDLEKRDISEKEDP